MTETVKPIEISTPLGLRFCTLPIRSQSQRFSPSFGPSFHNAIDVKHHNKALGEVQSLSFPVRALNIEQQSSAFSEDQFATSPGDQRMQITSPTDPKARPFWMIKSVVSSNSPLQQVNDIEEERSEGETEDTSFRPIDQS